MTARRMGIGYLVLILGLAAFVIAMLQADKHKREHQNPVPTTTASTR